MTDATGVDWPEMAAVLEHAADAITVQGPDGKLLYANRSAAAALGFETAEEVLATPLTEVLGRFALLDEAGEPLPLTALPSRRALAGETGPPSVVRFRNVVSGQERWSLVQAIPLFDESRSVRIVVNTFQDITDLKRTEQRLRLLADAGAVLGESVDHEETLRNLANLMVPGLADWCVVDVIDAQRPFRRVAVAHADEEKRQLAEEIERRYPPNFEQPGGVADVMRSGEPTLVSDLTPEMLQAAAQDDEHFRLLQAAGIASVAIMPLIARGQALGAMTMIGSPGGHRYEESDLPFLAELARRAGVAIDNSRLLHETSEAVRLRDDFLAMASHDMRTPLAVILANIQLGRRKLAGDGERGEVLRHLQSAERTTQKMSGLVSELMDITILRSGQALPLSLESIDLVALATACADEYQGLGDLHRIEVHAAEEVIGTWDGPRIERVLRNLLDNAIKYSPSGGLVRITVATTHANGDAQAVVAITDEGVGIPDDERATLFEKFHRGSNTRELRGTGLGLAGSRAVAEQLGGTIDVESELGVGSTFTVSLPLT